MAMPRKPIQIDRDKLRAEVRKLGNDSILSMLYDAIELLPPDELQNLANKYFDLKLLCPDEKPVARKNLLAEVKRFEKASLAGKYYESFAVNSRNFMQKSARTTAWMAEYCRLLDCCVNGANELDPMDVRDAMDILFGLLSHLDTGNDDIIFFADEAGSWQVGVDWDKVLPVWFKVLSTTTEPKEYARKITTLLSSHYSYGRDKMLKLAQKVATAEQREALADVKGAVRDDTR